MEDAAMKHSGRRLLLRWAMVGAAILIAAAYIIAKRWADAEDDLPPVDILEVTGLEGGRPVPSARPVAGVR